jgi:ribosomal protein S18 acetylase RimI-like enzyme
MGLALDPREEVSQGALDERPEKGDVVITSGSAWRGDRRTLAALLYEGYARKAAALRVDRETALAVLADALDLDRCFVAVRGGSAVGVVGLVEGRGRALAFPFMLVRRHFGLLRSLAYFLLLSIRRWTRPAAGELVFEALAVSPRERNQGIGTRLVERVEAYAREKGYRSVGLEVTDSNHTAIRLYSRLAYAIVRTRHYRFVPRQAGFSANHRMRKRV